ncbi:MAG: TonB family protein [Acidobacteria bacterium]|nr:TonB family protein [Acidobacteriota bacterium]
MLSSLKPHRLKAVLLLFLAVGVVPIQSQTAKRAILQTSRNREIPDASLPCSPEEAKWWQDVQQAAKSVKKEKGRRKEAQVFLDLMQLGQEKSYQPPVPDTKPFILSKSVPTYEQEARVEKINGVVTLSVELRADGFIGEVGIIKGLGHGLDERAADAARQTIFLPAVKDRKFVPYKVGMEMSFNIF